jgi:hypothetical protein
MLARVRLSEQRSRQVIDKIKKQFLEEVIQIIRTTLASLHAPGDTSESTHFLAERTSCLLQGGLMGGALLASVPVVVLRDFFMDYYIARLTRGSIK